METLTIHLIMNGQAGTDDELRDVVGKLRQQGHVVTPRVTWEGDQARMYTEEGIEQGCDVVVACGGDGTLHEVVNGVMGFDERPVVAGLPYGTGNDFLDSIGVNPRGGPGQLEDWLAHRPIPIDLGRSQHRYFLNMATAGAGTEVTAEASHQFKDVAGSFAYLVRGIPAAFDLPVHAASIDSPDLHWSGDLAFLFVGNGRQSGGGWTLCPAARLDDGLLDVVIVPDMPLREMARHGRQMVKAESTGDFGPIVYRQVESLQVAFEQQTAMNFDGEPIEETSFDFSVVEKPIQFLMPHPS